MRSNYLRIITLFVLILSSCSDKDKHRISEDINEILISTNCDVYSLSNKEHSSWRIIYTPEWITPIKDSGSVNDNIELYVESSHDLREGMIKIQYASGTTSSTKLVQSPDMEGNFSLSRAYAVGWSFDISTYMDSRGLREQVLNTQKIVNSEDVVYTIENHNVSKTFYYFGESTKELSDNMSAELNVDGKFNTFNLNIQGSFGKSAISNSKRIFSMVRGLYSQKLVYISNFDALDAIENNYFTTDFADMRKRIIDSNGSDEAIEEMIRRYGTHIILQSYLGGSFDYYYSSVVSSLDEDLDVKAAINFGFQDKFGLDADVKYKDSFNELSNEIIEKFSVLGGDAVPITNAVASGTIDKEMINQWFKSFTDIEKMELLHFELTPISDMFADNDDIKKKIENYTLRMYYRNISVTRSMSNF